MVLLRGGGWLWRSLYHVPSQKKWHMTGLGGMGGEGEGGLSRKAGGRSLYNEMDEEDRSLQPKLDS